MESIAILGPENTFSDIAYHEYQKGLKSSLKPVYYDNLEEVVKAAKDKNDYAIIPIENTLDGYIPGLLDLILEYQLKIIQSFCIPIQFSLVSNADCFENIETIYVQYKTKAQCIKFLSTLKNVNVIITESNMQSLKLMIKENEAAIIPKHAYFQKRFGIENVTDSTENETRFIIISKNESNIISDGRYKATLCITALEDKPGILYMVLGEFAKNNLNLSSIVSRPTKEKMGKYNFYIDLDIVISEKQILLDTIKNFNNTHIIKVINLGIYSV